MADPKSTTRFVSTDSKFDFYANVLSHAELYANNISANSFNVGSQTLEEYIQSVGGSSDVSNNYITSTFVSNNYLEDIKSTFGTGDVTNTYLTATFVSNNYLEDIKSTFGTGDVTNTYLNATFTANNYVQNHFIRSDQADTKTANLNFSDNVRVTFGDDEDFQILHNGVNTQLNNYTGTLQIIQRADDLDAVIYTDDGSGGITEYVRADGSTGEVILSHYGTQKLSTKTNGIDVSGSITVSGTVDGRDIASDGSTLDSISGSYTSNNYLVATFAANNYLISHFTSNNYIQTYVSSEIASLVDSAPTTLDTLNELAAALGDDPNFATTVTNQIGIRATNNYVNSTFSSNNYIQTQLGTKLDSSSYTASDVLTKIKTVDGSGSGLDADLLDGLDSSGLVSNNYFQDNVGGATGGGSDKIFHNNDQTVTTSYSIPTGQNSMTAGPISINSGVTVTVPSGSEWTIV